MGIGLLIEFVLELTFGLAYDTVTHSFFSYRDLAAVRGMTPPQREAFLQIVMLVMMADGGLSEEEDVALHSKLLQLEGGDAEDRVQHIKLQTHAALLEGRAAALVTELIAKLPDPGQRQAALNVAWEVHRIDDHHVDEKMVILHQLCNETGIFPSQIRE